MCLFSHPCERLWHRAQTPSGRFTTYQSGLLMKFPLALNVNLIIISSYRVRQCLNTTVVSPRKGAIYSLTCRRLICLHAQTVTMVGSVWKRQQTQRRMILFLTNWKVNWNCAGFAVLGVALKNEEENTPSRQQRDVSGRSLQPLQRLPEDQQKRETEAEQKRNKWKMLFLTL